MNTIKLVLCLNTWLDQSNWKQTQTWCSLLKTLKYEILQASAVADFHWDTFCHEQWATWNTFCVCVCVKYTVWSLDMTHQSSRLNLIYIVYISSFLFCILSLPLTRCWPLTSPSVIHKRRQLLCQHGCLIGIIIWIMSGANNNVRCAVSVNHSRKCAVHGTVDLNRGKKKRVHHFLTIYKWALIIQGRAQMLSFSHA